MLPKFLIADNSQEQPEHVFVVHTEGPRFIVQCDLDDIDTDQVIHWLDEQPSDEDIISDLVEEAMAFLEKELDNQENLFDEDEE